MIMFEKIEVVNYLDKGAVLQTIRNYTSDYDKTWIYDRIHHSVNQFCSLHTLQEVYIDLFDTIDDQLVAVRVCAHAQAHARSGSARLTRLWLRTQDLQRDCNVWAPGLHIINCRVTKPKIPCVSAPDRACTRSCGLALTWRVLVCRRRSISDNFENMEAEKTRLMISQQRQRVVELGMRSSGTHPQHVLTGVRRGSRIAVAEAETERRRQNIQAQMQKEVAQVELERDLRRREGEQKMAEISGTLVRAGVLPVALVHASAPARTLASQTRCICRTRRRWPTRPSTRSRVRRRRTRCCSRRSSSCSRASPRWPTTRRCTLASASRRCSSTSSSPPTT